MSEQEGHLGSFKSSPHFIDKEMEVDETCSTAPGTSELGTRGLELLVQAVPISADSASVGLNQSQIENTHGQ
jgi:hypothetical protein